MDKTKPHNSIEELIDIMALLRSKDGCQWDQNQTAQSLKKHILEETYEVLEAIDKGNPDDICDELGDLLLQVVFQAQIFSEAGLFTFSDVAESISNKLKRRHPHVFADASHAEHEQRWEQIKQQERSERGQSNNLTHRISQTLPALKRCTKIANAYFQHDPLETIQQMQIQLNRLAVKHSTKNEGAEETEDCLGQLLLNICFYSATIGVDAEDLLRSKTTQLLSDIDT